MVTKLSEPVYVGKVRLPGSFLSVILRRTMSDKELLDLLERYREVCQTERGAQEPSELQFTIAKDVKKTGIKPLKASVKYKVTVSQVSSAVQRVAVWEYLNEDK